jgi:glycerol uptake facilitator-like aquaporin
LDHSQALSKNVEHVAFARLVRDSTFELMLTSVLLFGVVSIVRWMIGPSPTSRAIPGIYGELWIVGATVGLLLAWLIMSPPGRTSRGHANPAISLAMSHFGVFPAAGVVPYAIAQLLGSIVGVVAARAVWGQDVADPPVVFAVIKPAPLWSAAPLFAAEATGMGLIVFIVGYCLSGPRLALQGPWVVGLLIGLGIALLGTSTGGSLNPARQFGPAVVSGHTDELWVFLAAPMAGAGIAARLLQAFQRRRKLLTHRLCGTHPDDRRLDERSGTAQPVALQVQRLRKEP